MKKFVLLVVTVLCANILMAQDEEGEDGFQQSKLFAGGNFGLAFGNYTLINISPQVGYRFNRYFSSGLGINLVYTSQKEEDYYGNDYRKIVQGITGLNVFARFYPTSQLLLQIQPEANYIFGKQIFYQPTEQTYQLDAEIVPSLLVGGGMAIPTGNGALITTIMYDILQKPNSAYGSRPIVYFGYNFSF
jgi:hypothetical protein